MTSKKLLLTAAAMAFPLSFANAQLSATTDAATQGSATTKAMPTQATQPVADTAVPASEAAVDSAASTATTADAAATGDSSVTATAQATPAADTPVAVAKADVQTGASVHGSDGAVIGKIESVSADAAVISTGKAKAQIPFSSIGKTGKGLVIAMSKTEFEAAASPLRNRPNVVELKRAAPA